MIRPMRHGSPPRLMALQPILSLNRRESLPTPSAGDRITDPHGKTPITSFQLPTFSGGVRTPCVVGIGRDSVSGTKSPAGEVPHGCDDPPVVGGRARRMRVRGSAFGPAPAQTHRAHGGRDRGKVITQGVGRRGWREAERSASAPPLRGTLEADCVPSWDAPISNA